MVALHVVPEFQTVTFGGRLEHITDQEGSVSQLTHQAVHIQIITWRKHTSDIYVITQKCHHHFKKKNLCMCSSVVHILY